MTVQNLRRQPFRLPEPLDPAFGLLAPLGGGQFDEPAAVDLQIEEAPGEQRCGPGGSRLPAELALDLGAVPSQARTPGKLDQPDVASAPGKILCHRKRRGNQ